MTRPLPTFRDLLSLARLARRGAQEAVQAELGRWPPLRRYRGLVARTALGGGHMDLFLDGIAGLPPRRRQALLNTALIKVAKSGQVAHAQQLLEAGANPQTSNSLPLARAAHFGHEGLVRLLLPLSRAHTQSGRPLGWAIWAGHTDLAILLAQHTSIGRSQYTAIERAAYSRDPNILTALLQWLPDLPRRPQNDRNTPSPLLSAAFLLALNAQWVEGAQLLKQASADPLIAPFEPWVSDCLAEISAGPSEPAWQMLWQALQAGDPQNEEVIGQHYQTLEGCIRGDHPARIAAVLNRLRELAHQPVHPWLAKFEKDLPAGYPSHAFKGWIDDLPKQGLVFPIFQDDPQPPTDDALSCVVATLTAGTGRTDRLEDLLEQTRQQDPSQLPNQLNHALMGAIEGEQTALSQTLLDRWLALNPPHTMGLWFPHLLGAIRHQQHDLLERLQAQGTWDTESKEYQTLVVHAIHYGTWSLLDAWGSAWWSLGPEANARQTSVHFDAVSAAILHVPQEQRAPLLERIRRDFPRPQRERLIFLAVSKAYSHVEQLVEALIFPHEGTMAARLLQAAAGVAAVSDTVMGLLMVHTDWAFDDGRALSAAAYHGCDSHVAALLPHGEPPAHAGRALLQAVERGSAECVALLLPSSAVAWREAAHRAAREGKARILSLILDHAPDERDGCWALAVDQSTLSEAVLDVLDERGADPSAHHARLVARAAVLTTEGDPDTPTDANAQGQWLLARYAPRSQLHLASAWLEGDGSWNRENLQALDALAPWADEATLTGWLAHRPDSELPGCRAALRQLQLAQRPATLGRARTRV